MWSWYLKQLCQSSGGSAPFPPTKTPARTAHGPTKAEQAVWSDPEHLARIEAVLDDPGLAVPLEKLE